MYSVKKLQFEKSWLMISNLTTNFHILVSTEGRVVRNETTINF